MSPYFTIFQFLASAASAVEGSVCCSPLRGDCSYAAALAGVCSILSAQDTVPAEVRVALSDNAVTTFVSSSVRVPPTLTTAMLTSESQDCNHHFKGTLIYYVTGSKMRYFVYPYPVPK